MRSILFFLPMLIFGCSSNRDGYTEIIVQNIRISYFKKYVKDDEAKNAAYILKKELNLNDEGIYGFGIIGDVDGFSIIDYRRVISKDRDGDIFYNKIGQVLSRDAFAGAPVDYCLCNIDSGKKVTIKFEPVLPELPIEVYTRTSVGGGGLVCQFKNLTSKHLVLNVNAFNKTLNTKKNFSLIITPNSIVEHGWAEGWNYVSGDKVELSNADYKKKVVFIK